MSRAQSTPSSYSLARVQLIQSENPFRQPALNAVDAHLSRYKRAGYRDTRDVGIGNLVVFFFLLNCFCVTCIYDNCYDRSVYAFYTSSRLLFTSAYLVQALSKAKKICTRSPTKIRPSGIAILVGGMCE